MKLPFFISTYFLVCLGFCPVDAAAEEHEISLQSFYLGLEKDYAKMATDAINANKMKFIKEGGQIDSEFTSKFIARTFQVEYQMLVTVMYCATLYKGEVFKSCLEALGVKLTEMTYFIDNYNELDGHGLNISACKAKSRSFYAERTWPPYAFMKIEGIAPPKAYDPGAFMECVRK